eukprot:8264127-Pyramimonas_sp.AAC.1
MKISPRVPERPTARAHKGLSVMDEMIRTVSRALQTVNPKEWMEDEIKLALRCSITFCSNLSVAPLPYTEKQKAKARPDGMLPAVKVWSKFTGESQFFHFSS